VAGEPLPHAADPIGEALDRVRRYAQRPIDLELPDGKRQALKPARLGVEIDRMRLGELIKAAHDPSAPLGRAHLAARGDDPAAVLKIPIPVRIDTERALAELLLLKGDIDRPPGDALVDLQKKTLVKETWGYRFDVYGTLANIDAALRAGRSSAKAAVERIKPRVLAEQLGNVKFDEVLGYFETRYSKSRRYRARTYNLRLAASRLDGTVLLPGEVFDFNGTVGPRDEAHGYKVAPVIAQGELVDGIGGGTCQISGTLHGAAFFAGLDVVERYPHSRPSYYIKLGMDATVVYPTINFRLRNNFDHPVVLHQTVKDGVVRAEILGPRRRRTVSFFRRVDEVIPFEQEERETDALPRGDKRLSQRGMPGFRLSIFRIVRDGAYATRTKLRDRYPPTTQIVLVGTGAKDVEAKKKDDRHPEYVADEYLVITQGPGIRSKGVKEPEPGGGTVENRIPGSTGRHGWQEKAGMPIYQPDDDEEPS
jgi:vancomycin resistance protein YoaR